MVCESGQQKRRLQVHRRGSFFEDPFFRDARDDYSNAVRRIVDRFNRGWVDSPSGRLRDSQYHSMYRTLRSARLNYSNHSARFKEEGDVYKLVMDVHEFIGGDISVRTTKGTVSVRGKMESCADEGAKKTAGDADEDDDDRSSLSGRSSSARTLHRRFTVPPDADCEKVESALSVDGVLTVTIPKRMDIHYVPVSIEGENKENGRSSENKENGRSSENKKNERSEKKEKRRSENGGRLAGVKRPSDSPLEQSSKKAQDDETNRRRRRERRKERKREDKEEGHKSRGEDRGEGEARKREKKEGKREKQEGKIEQDCGRNDDRVIIPVSFNEGDSKRGDRSPKVRHIAINRDWLSDEDARERLRGKAASNALRHANGDAEDDMEARGNLLFHWSNGKDDSKDEPRPKKAEARPEVKVYDFGMKSDSRRPSRPEEKAGEGCPPERILFERNADKCGVTLSFNAAEKSDGPAPSSAKEPEGGRARVVPVEEETEEEEEEGEDDGREDDEKEKERKGGKDAAPTIIREFLVEDEDEDEKEDGKEAEKEAEEAESDSPKSRLDTPRMSLFERPASPISPGSRSVKVEESQSPMEEGIFQDCWKDFSNTLQDVLSRLQELSSELGQAKLLAPTPTATPSADQPPPFPGQESAPSGPGSGNPPSAQSEPLSRAPPAHSSRPSPPAKGISAHGDISVVGGEEGREGVAWDNGSPAHSPRSKVQGHTRGSRPSEGSEVLAEPSRRPASFSEPSEGSESFSDPSRRPGSFQPSRVSAFLPTRPPQESCPWPSGTSHTRSEGGVVDDVSLPPVTEENGRADPFPLAAPPPHALLSEEEEEEEEFFTPDDADSGRSYPWEYPASRLRGTPPAGGEGGWEGAGPVGGAGRPEGGAGRPEGGARRPEGGARSERSRSLPDGQSESTRERSEFRSSLASDVSSDAISDVSSDAVSDAISDVSSDANDAAHRRLRALSPPAPRPFHLSPPSQRRGSPPAGVADVSRDVTGGASASARRPEIASDDAMVCDRAKGATAAAKGAAKPQPPLSFSRANRPRDLSLPQAPKEAHGDADRRRDAGMGGFLSRGRRPPSEPSTPTKGRRTPAPETPLPPYVRARPEAPKRPTGFAHVQSDNVRRMRDVWGSRAPPSPLRPPSGAPPKGCESPRGGRAASRSSGGTRTPRDSPSSVRSCDGFFRDSPRASPPPPRANGYASPKASTPPRPDASRRSSQASQGRASPAPSSPAPNRRANGRPRAPSSGPPTPTGAESPRATKAHQKVFRRFRDASLLPESEAICFREEKDKYKMVLDVEEFVPGEIEVLQEDRVLTVKGRVETKERRGSDVTVKTFSRTFAIPNNSREEDIDSALSVDGILTIFVPKKRERIIKIELVD